MNNLPLTSMSGYPDNIFECSEKDFRYLIEDNPDSVPTYTNQDPAPDQVQPLHNNTESVNDAPHLRSGNYFDTAP